MEAWSMPLFWSCEYKINLDCYNGAEISALSIWTISHLWCQSFILIYVSYYHDELNLGLKKKKKKGAEEARVINNYYMYVNRRDNRGLHVARGATLWSNLSCNIVNSYSPCYVLPRVSAKYIFTHIHRQNAVWPEGNFTINNKINCQDMGIEII